MSKVQCQRFNVKGLITSRNSKDRQYNGKKKKDKRTNNNVQNITPKSKDRTFYFLDNIYFYIQNINENNITYHLSFTDLKQE
jgi:hypothetical protein